MTLTVHTQDGTVDFFTNRPIQNFHNPRHSNGTTTSKPLSPPESFMLLMIEAPRKSPRQTLNVKSKKVPYSPQIID